MLRPRRTALIALALLGVAILVSGGTGTWSAFSATTANGPATVTSTADWTAPTVGASVIAHSSKGPGLGAGRTYNVYANVTDSGNPASGVSTVTANVSSITSGSTAVALTSCSSSCTVGGVTYAYKSAQLTAGSGLAAGSVSYTVSGKDVAGNTGSATSFSVTADNTIPTVGAGVVAHATAGAAIKRGGTYFVYANASDSGSGVDTITANVGSITSGQSSVALTSCSSSCTVGSTTYAYKSAQLTAKSTLSGTQSFTITATDAAGNPSSATSFNTTVDNTAPTATDVQTKNNGTTAGKAEAGDTITLMRSEQMDPNSVFSGWTGTATNIVVRISNSGSSDHVTFWDASNATQLPLGSVNLGTSGYVNSGATVTFGATGTASTLVQSGTNWTITLGTPSGTTRTVTTKSSMIWTPSTVPTDLAGNAATSATATESGLSDVEF
jgi:hypothetical protein